MLKGEAHKNMQLFWKNWYKGEVIIRSNSLFLSHTVRTERVREKPSLSHGLFHHHPRPRPPLFQQYSIVSTRSKIRRPQCSAKNNTMSEPPHTVEEGRGATQLHRLDHGHSELKDRSPAAVCAHVYVCACAQQLWFPVLAVDRSFSPLLPYLDSLLHPTASITSSCTSSHSLFLFPFLSVLLFLILSQHPKLSSFRCCSHICFQTVLSSFIIYWRSS